MGLSTGTATQFVDISAVPFVIYTEIEYIAANGDKLCARFEGFGIPDPSFNVTFIGGTTYCGGSGRFANATGGSLDSGTASLLTGTGVFEVGGRINY
jgi:hypothetical protein